MKRIERYTKRGSLVSRDGRSFPTRVSLVVSRLATRVFVFSKNRVFFLFAADLVFAFDRTLTAS